MNFLVDTCVWSLALRRDKRATDPAIQTLHNALTGDDLVVTTGLILQELLQGFNGPRAREQIIQQFGALPFITASRQDHIEAAELRNVCRRAGIQLGTIDALIAQICIGNGLTLLTTDNDFVLAARHCPLQIWRQ